MADQPSSRAGGESRPAFSAGEVLAGRFQVRGLLGKGGMGEIYEADDLELHDRVALKVVRPLVAVDQSALDRFRREVFLARKVTHPNICRLFDVFHHHAVGPDGPRDYVFLSMELVRGETLAERLRRTGPLATAEALPLVEQIAAGLGAAHAAGVVHGDLKANNILLSKGGPARAVVSDFGLASSLDRPRRTAQDNEIFGTPAYMAPEQLAGGSVTPATDIYAFGIVIHEMLTGAAPELAGAPTVALPRNRGESTDAPPAASLPQPWRGVIERCLQKDPLRRFQNVRDLVHALGGGTSAAGVALAKKLRRARVAAVAALVLVAAALGWMLLRKQRTGAAPLKAVQVTSSLGMDVHPSFSPDGASVAYASSRSGRFQIYVRALGATSQETQVTNGGDSLEPAWSPDGRTIAYYSADRGGIWLVSASGGTSSQLTDFGSRPVWSPDGTRIAFQSDAVGDLASNAAPARAPSTLWVVPAAGGAPARLTQPDQPPGGHGTPCWSADARAIVFGVYSRSEASLWSVASGGGEAHRVYDRMRYVYDPACAASRDQIVFSAVLPGAQWALLKATLDPKDGTFRGEPSQVLVAGAGAPRFLAISRDARRMAYSALSQQSNLMSLPLTAGGEAAGPRQPLTAETGRNTRPAFSPDGSHIAFEKWAQNTNPDVWVMNADGSNPVQITADPGQDGSPSFTPDGRSVVFLSTRNGRQGLWSADLDTQTPRLLFEPARKIELPRLSPSGRLVAFGASDITGNVWTRTLEGGVEEQVTHDPEFMGYPAWSPDSRRLAVQMRRGDQTNVAVVLLAGGAVEQLTFDEGQSWAYSWSPDGGRVAFAGSRGGLWNIFAVDVATRTVRQLTRQERLDTYVRYPAWSPRGTQMVYEESLSTGNVWMLEDVP